MAVKMHPIICILGKKDTGKTGLAEKIIYNLANRKIKVAAAKHTTHIVELDKEGTDSHRFQKAGADPVILFSASGVSTYTVSESEISSVDEIEKKINTMVDVIILEGFSETVRKDNRVAKIICYSSREQLQEHFNNVTPPILGYYSYKDTDSIDFNELMKRIDNYIFEFKTIYNFYKLLPKIDCLKCGYNSCFEMARKIYEGEADLNDCPVISGESLNIEVTVNGTKLSLKPFPAKIIRNTVIALISSLKQVDEKLVGKITINVDKN